jgi:uncharacterized protein YhaN
MAENLENERKMAKVETDLANIKELLLDIKDELKGLNQTYVPRTEIIEMFRSRDEQIKEIKNNQNSSKHLWASWAAVIVAAVAILVTLFK